MKKLITICLSLATSIVINAQTPNAQTHFVKCDYCKLSKNYANRDKNASIENQGCGCPVCGETENKERIAKAAELKKREEALAAKIKAENEAKEKIYLEERQRKLDEEKARIKASEVQISVKNSKEDLNTGKNINLNDEELNEMEKYSIKYNEESSKAYAPRSISILYNSNPIFTTSEYSYIFRVSKKALIYYGIKPSLNMSCDERSSKNSGVFINEKGEPISIGGINLIHFASESDNVIKFRVLDGNCYPDNSSGYSLLNYSLRGITEYKYNLLDLSLISSEQGKISAACPCGK